MTTALNTEQIVLLQEQSRRQAIRDLLERYLYCLDRRDSKGLAELFTEDE
jgi:hypothetical protein